MTVEQVDPIVVLQIRVKRLEELIEKLEAQSRKASQVNALFNHLYIVECKQKILDEEYQWTRTQAQMQLREFVHMQREEVK